MRILILIAILVASASAQSSPITVLDSGWIRDRKPAPKFDNTRIGPVREVLAMNKKFPRQAREQQSPGALDPNEQTIDGRSAALDRINDDVRRAKPEPVNGFTYRATLRNDTGEAVDIVFLEFQFREIADPSNFVRRQFLCSVRMKSGAQTDISVFSTLGPSDTISAGSIGNEKDLFKASVAINRIELKNGAILQRDGWNFSELKASVERAAGTPWSNNEMCRGL